MERSRRRMTVVDTVTSIRWYGEVKSCSYTEQQQIGIQQFLLVGDVLRNLRNPDLHVRYFREIKWTHVLVARPYVLSVNDVGCVGLGLLLRNG